MKKNITLKRLLAANLLLINSLSMFASSSTCAGLTEQTTVEQDKMEYSSFYAFHVHDINPDLTEQFHAKNLTLAKPIGASLYEQYNNMPLPIQDEIMGYLTNFKRDTTKPLNFKDLIDYLQSTTTAWDQNRKKTFEKVMPYRTYLDKEDLLKEKINMNYINDCLRTEYWCRNLIKIYNKSMGNDNELACSPLCLINPCTDEILSMSCKRDYIKTAALALACGASIQDYKKLNALYHAIKNDSDKMVALLIAAGFYTTNKTESDTPMHDAASQNALKVIRYLHSIGHDLNSRTKSLGFTPLERAYWFSHKQTIELLLSLGADPSIKDSDGKLYYQIGTLKDLKSNFRFNDYDQMSFNWR